MRQEDVLRTRGILGSIVIYGLAWLQTEDTVQRKEYSFENFLTGQIMYVIGFRIHLMSATHQVLHRNMKLVCIYVFI